MKNAIEAKELCVSFGSNRVLDRLSLSVPQGTVCALLGPNGAGKTTLIKTLLNIYPKQSGSSSILGQPSDKLCAADFLRIGFVAESQELPLSMTVQSFLRFCRAMYPNWDDSWMRERLNQFNLMSSLVKPLGQLSRGMRVKAALISSLAYRPELLILDEPFSGLDPIGRDDFISSIIELAADVQATTFISSHDLHEVEQISDSIAVLTRGQIATHASLDELLSRYKTVTVELPFAEQVVVGELPARWLQAKQDGRFLRFVATDYDNATMSARIEEYWKGAVISNIDEVPLKEIYRILSSDANRSE